MKKSELLQMIREEYGRALITEAPSKRAQAIKVASDAMYKHLKEFEKAAKKVDMKLYHSDGQLVKKFELIEKRMRDIYQYLEDADFLIPKVED